MKLLLTTLLTTLLTLTSSCASVPYNFTTGTPKINFTGSPRLTMVARPYQLKFTLLGRLPSPDQSVAIILKVWYNERALAFTTINQRVNTLILYFTELDFYEAVGKLRGNEHGDTWIDRSMMDPEQYSAATTLEDDEGSVPIDIEIWLVDPHPTDPARWVKTDLWLRGRWKVKLSCPHCLM